MSSALEYNMSYDSIPVSRRIENSAKSIVQPKRPETILGRDIDWKVGLNKVDPNSGMTPIMIAAQQGRLELVLALLERGAILDMKDEKKGRTALHYAAKGGHCHVLIELMKRDALVNNPDNFSKTPLILASKNGYLDCVSALISRGAGVNMSDVYGCAALHYAAKFGHHEVASRLLDMTAAIEMRDNDEGYAALHYAARYGRKETVICLLAYGAKINRRTTKDKVTPLMLASKEGNKTIVSILLQKGGDCYFVDIFGWTALHYAASWGRRDTAHILIVEGKANVNHRTKDKNNQPAPTPLIIAVKGNQIDMIKLFMHYGVDMNMIELLHGQNALACAAEYGCLDSMQCLLDYAVDINFQNPYTGSTALMIAVSKGYRNIIILLLNYYADMNILDKQSHTVYEYATLKTNKLENLLLAILEIHPSAKVNVLPWLEVHIIALLDSCQGNSGHTNVVYDLLYGKKGIYYGLYQLTNDCDVYLIYSLVMILVICYKCNYYTNTMKNSISTISNSDNNSDNSSNTNSYSHYINQLERMLLRCMNSQLLSTNTTTNNNTNSIFVDCFLIGKFPSSQLPLTTTTTTTTSHTNQHYLSHTIWYGPLALYMYYPISTTWLITSYTIQQTIYTLFWTCCKPIPTLPTTHKDSNSDSYHSVFLSFRYTPAHMFLLEGISHTVLLLLIIYQTCIISTTTTATATTMDWSMIEILISIFIISLILYEYGLLEEKRYAISPSIIYTIKELEKQRYQQIIHHFLDVPWKWMDVCTLFITLIWLILRIIHPTIALPCLAISVIPLAIGILRYPTILWFPRVHIECLFIFNVCKDIILMYIFLFVVILCTFVIPLYGIYHTQLDQFHTPLLTMQILFNSILSSSSSSNSYDENMFHHTTNPSIGIILIILFVIIVIIVLINCMLSNIIHYYLHKRKECIALHYTIQYKYIQQYSLVLDKSILAMLPPPFTLFLLPFYPLHVYHIWQSRLCLTKEHCISLGSTLSDRLLGLVLLLPCACYEYIVLHLLHQPINTNMILTMLYTPIGIAYIIYCLGYQLYIVEPSVKVILKTRISDGRLRIDYHNNDTNDNSDHDNNSDKKKRREWEDQTLTRFEDMRVYKTIEQYTVYVMKETGSNNNNSIGSGNNDGSGDRKKYYEAKEEEEEEERNTNNNKMKKSTNNKVGAISGKWVPSTKVIKSMKTMKTTTFIDDDENDDDSNTLHPTNNNTTNLPNMMKQFILKPFQKRQIDYLGNKNIRIAPYQPFIQLHHLPSNNNNTNNTLNEVKAGIPNIVQAEKGTKYDAKQPIILSSYELDSIHACSMIPNLDTNDINDTNGNDDHRPAVIWSSSSPNAPLINPYQPGIISASQWDELAGEMDIIPPSVKTTTAAKQQQGEVDEQQQSKDVLLRINFPSMYYLPQRFPAIFTTKERKDIFEEVLPELFVDDFAYAVNHNEEMILQLQNKLQTMENMQSKQLTMMQSTMNNMMMMQQQQQQQQQQVQQQQYYYDASADPLYHQQQQQEQQMTEYYHPPATTTITTADNDDNDYHHQFAESALYSER